MQTSYPSRALIKYRLLTVIFLCVIGFNSYAQAADSTSDDQLRKEYDELKQTVQLLNEKLQSLEAKLTQVEESEPQAVQSQSNLDNAYSGDSIYHIAGYADAGFYGTDGGDGSFATGSFAPILHYQYKDLVLFEGEIAFVMERGPNGETLTETEIEYMSIDLFLNDYAALVVGKFLSPIGQFVQNLHPSWINKLPSAPIGFSAGHGGSQAAPVAEFGIQLRGGAQFSERRLNYALYVGNGPAMLVEEGDDGLEIEGIDTTGRLSSEGTYSTGGRIGFIPLPDFEVGLSLAVGEASVAEAAGHGDETMEPDEGDDHDEAPINNRDYLVYGFDFYYSPRAFRSLAVRGEYVRTSLGNGQLGEADPGESVWEAWYVQASYLWEKRKLEPVLRYGQYNDPHGEEATQWAMGVNYLFSNNLIGKFAYEFNESNEEAGAANQYGVQLAYGF
ncbi:MAG: hypothetical protein R3F07_04215 [Opitutaceae bacterium]